MLYLYQQQNNGGLFDDKRIVSPVLSLSVAAIFLSAPFLFAQQTTQPNNTITLTTYYPAPFGAYKKMTVSDSIGIGTTNPQAKLDIGGTPGVDGIRFPDGTIQKTAAGNFNGGWVTINNSSPQTPADQVKAMGLIPVASPVENKFYRGVDSGICYSDTVRCVQTCLCGGPPQDCPAVCACAATPPSWKDFSSTCTIEAVYAVPK